MSIRFSVPMLLLACQHESAPPIVPTVTTAPVAAPVRSVDKLTASTASSSAVSKDFFRAFTGVYGTDPVQGRIVRAGDVVYLDIRKGSVINYIRSETVQDAPFVAAIAQDGSIEIKSERVQFTGRLEGDAIKGAFVKKGVIRTFRAELAASLPLPTAREGFIDLLSVTNEPDEELTKRGVPTALDGHAFAYDPKTGRVLHVGSTSHWVSGPCQVGALVTDAAKLEEGHTSTDLRTAWKKVAPNDRVQRLSTHLMWCRESKEGVHDLLLVAHPDGTQELVLGGIDNNIRMGDLIRSPVVPPLEWAGE
jgi:hypothetical protein